MTLCVMIVIITLYYKIRTGVTFRQFIGSIGVLHRARKRDLPFFNIIMRKGRTETGMRDSAVSNYHQIYIKSYRQYKS